MGAPASLAEELRQVETYEDYLDSFLTDNDRIYLSDVSSSSSSSNSNSNSSSSRQQQQQEQQQQQTEADTAA
ncbi:hypothetical protein, conserved [Eimeria maxima]|uniref:Uncharacterized protein n=1 Tax=Eimeria maxima TaxID=5804 RepID=U6ME30_EIMMA|nr:hypothetical protein, conserved [Eimeria maxima]CDJ60699.1 hypothetical protein, conserved [Eimeria maxima]